MTWLDYYVCVYLIVFKNFDIISAVKSHSSYFISIPNSLQNGVCTFIMTESAVNCNMKYNRRDDMSEFFSWLASAATVAKYVSLLSTYTFENYSLLTYSCTDNEPADHHIGISHHLSCHMSPITTTKISSNYTKCAACSKYNSIWWIWDVLRRFFNN